MSTEPTDKFEGAGADWNPGAVQTPPSGLPGDPSASYIAEATAVTPPPSSDRTDLPTWVTIKGDAPCVSPDETPNRPQISFKLIRRVGLGGCGEVWEAVQGSLERVIAVKKLREDLYSTPEEKEEEPDFTASLQAEFRLEALTTARLEHPNIVPVHDFGQDEQGRPLLAMKLVKGKPWNEILSEDAKLRPLEFLARHLPILVDVAQAISFAHSKGIIHRDLKPSQVMVGKFGEVVLMDWGLAVKCIALPDNISNDTTEIPTTAVSALDTARNPAGTPSYMAPEQTYDHPSELGTWTDIFLLGGMLYRLLTLTPPYDSHTAEECFAQACLGEVKLPRKRAPDREIPRQLSNLAMACLQAHPQDRIRNAQEFISGIQDYLSGAGKRDEARRLVGQVEEMLEAGVRDYRTLSRAHHLLERARGLWPENRQVVEIRDQVLQAYAHEAIRQGDLVLARLEAEQVRNSEDRDPLMAEIDRKESEHRVHARQRRQLVVVLVFVLLTLGFLTWRHLAERREKEETLAAQNDALIKQRNTAWDMMDFMLNDLQRDLESSENTDVLASMAEKAVEYFEGLPEHQLAGGVLRQSSLAWQNLGDVRLRIGRTDDAVTAYRAAREAAASLVAGQPQNGPWLSDLAERELHLGVALLAQGDTRAAVEEIEGAVIILQKRLAAEPDNAEIAGRTVSALLQLARAANAAGDADAESHLDRAREILRETSPSGSDDNARLEEQVRATAALFAPDGNAAPLE